MTLQDAIRKMMDFYRAVEAVYADLPDGVEVENEAEKQFNGCLIEASDAMTELEKMQTVGVNCEHCKFDGSCANACKECMFYWLATVDQKRPFYYEPA